MSLLALLEVDNEHKVKISRTDNRSFSIVNKANTVRIGDPMRDRTLTVINNLCQVTIDVTESGMIRIIKDPQEEVIVEALVSVLGGEEWIDYVTKWTYVDTTIIVGGSRLAYTDEGLTIYRFVPDPYVLTDDAFYNDEALVSLKARRY